MTGFVSPLRRALLFGCSLVAAAGLVECGRQSLAAYLIESGALEAMLAAAKLVPTRADLYRDLAFLDPDHGAEYLKAALQRNPADSRSWSQLALLEEVSGRYEEALHALQQAAAHDSGFTPSWALCSYYFRRNNDEQFWKWAARAAESDVADLQLVIDLCWRRKPDPRAVLELIPDTCNARKDFFTFLREHSDDPAAAIPVARSLASCEDTRTRDLLLEFVTRSVLRQMPDTATEVWNLLSNRGRIPYGPLGHRGNFVVNGNFANLPSRQGFDWHFDPVQGVSMRVGNDPATRLQVDFTGAQPVATSVLWQPLRLENSRDYELVFTHAIEGSAPRAGLHWRLTAIRNGAPLVPDSPGWEELPGEGGGRARWRFRSPSGEPLPILMLYYSRPHGQVNLHGTVSLGSIRLRRLAAGE